MKARPSSLKKKSRSALALLAFGVLVLPVVPQTALAQKWTNWTGGTWDWTDGTNWEGGAAPLNPSTEQVLFEHRAKDHYIYLNTDGDQVLGGGMRFTVSASGGPTGLFTLDLLEKSLIFNGEALIFDVNATSDERVATIFTNGTIQFGTAENSADLILGSSISGGGNNANAFWLQFGQDGVTTTLDSRNLANLTVASDSVNQNRNMVLDLTRASFRTDSELDVLTVTGDIAIASATIHNVSTGRDRTGLLKMGEVSTIRIGNDLVVGQYIRSATGNVSRIKVDGELELASASTGPLTLNLGHDLRVGVGDSATGKITGAPSVLNLEMGDAGTAVEDRGSIYIGFKEVGQQTDDGDTSGSFVGGTEGGEVAAYVKEFRIGQNTRTGGSATGVLDFRNASTILLDVAGDAVIGSGVSGVGEVYFSRGSASSETLSVGNATSTLDRSVLSLGETRWTVTETLEIGALGEILLVATESGGIDLLSSDQEAFSIADDGFLEATFDVAAGSDPLWALRWAGKHDVLLADYLDIGKLRVTGAFGADATVFYDGEYTYLGLAQAIPEPSTLLLLGVAGGLGVFGARFRRRG